MKKAILIITLSLTSACAMAQMDSLHPNTAKKATAPPDSIKVATADFNSIMQEMSLLINNSSDISTKQANCPGGLNEVIKKMYSKYISPQPAKK